MRVLFLDIDGVLNSAQFLRKNPGAFDRTGSRKSWHVNMLDPVACERLSRILKETKAKVVISSTWRLTSSPEQIQGFLEKRGVKANVIGETPSSLRGERGQEIQAWLKNHPKVTNYVVIDDDSDMTGVEHRFVKTTWAKGLQEKHVKQVIALFETNDDR